ncbi:MAG: glycoside hydrolase family 130 protein [Bacteroidales bacterium]|nr:glycoside hydrolase family 130 protein [Bacteroidales bacterium]
MNDKSSPINVNKQGIRFAPDDSRVITKFYSPNKKRIHHIINRVLDLSDQEVSLILKQILKRFSHRHGDIKRVFKDNYDRVALINIDISLERRLLIGSYFTMEYSIESAALFNPSIVIHPNQGYLNEGDLRVIISFRAVGEGHVSSIVFREGVVNINGDLILDPKSPIVERPKIIPNPTYIKKDFVLKLKEINAYNLVKDIFNDLLDEFTIEELYESIEKFKKNTKIDYYYNEAIETLLWLADSTYEVEFDNELSLSGRVIFPLSKNDIKGLEDARFMLFEDEEGNKRYYATYSAYNGLTILPQLIETKDFVQFRISTLMGSGSQNKGMVLFPEKIYGKYMMVSRNDNENLFIMISENINYWENPIMIKKPDFYWEFYQIGNCSAPLKTEKGWLLLTHGVGPVRTYCIGAVLLDLKDPLNVIGVMKEPLLFPNENERNGYVPNVVYSCGALIYCDNLILPYAMSDTRSGIAVFNVNEILDNMI